MTDREQLAARIEAADASEQRELLGAAFNVLNRAPRTSFEDLNAHCARGLRFKKLIDAEAYLDAAMMLVDAIRWKVRNLTIMAPCADCRKWHVVIHGGVEGEKHSIAFANTRVNALAAAALRAGGA